MPQTILETTKLTKIFTSRRGVFGTQKIKTKAVNEVSFSLRKGETLGLVGESGCGKSTLGLSLMRLYEVDSGQIFFEGQDITNFDENHLKPIRQKMQMIFQDPFASLDPRLTIEQIITEPLEIHNLGTKAERTQIAAELLTKVGLSSQDLYRFPTEFSGGQQQRIGIARALTLRPKLIICDEPVSSLDVSVQAQILNLLRDLQDEFDLSYLFISHNIAVTAFMSHRIGVMYLGKLVELGTNEQIITTPQHPYTKTLLAAIPDPDPSKRKEEINLNDQIAENEEEPKGCVFYKRCPIAQEICNIEEPQFRRVEEKTQVACHFV